MLKHNEKGITLLEILFTLAILSIVGTIAWSILAQGTKYSNQSVTKNQMQQEANILISELTKIHQREDEYKISSKNCEVTITITPAMTVIKKNSDTMCFYINDDNSNNQTFELTVNPNIDEPQLWINLTEKRDSNNHIKVETIMYRLK